MRLDSPAQGAGGHVSHGDGGIEALRTFKETKEFRGGRGAISVDECQPGLVRRLPESRKHSAAFANRGVVSDPIQVVMPPGEGFDDVLGAVGASVEDDEEIDAMFRPKGGLCEVSLQRRSDAGGLILRRHHH